MLGGRLNLPVRDVRNLTLANTHSASCKTTLSLLSYSDSQTSESCSRMIPKGSENSIFGKTPKTS